MRRGFGRGEGGEASQVDDSSRGGVSGVSAWMLGSWVGYVGGVCVCVLMCGVGECDASFWVCGVVCSREFR